MGVLPTDSCYYVIGTFTDSVSPVRAGALWGKIDLDGNLLGVKTFHHPDRNYFNDYGDIKSTPEGFLYNAGSLNDTAYSVQIIFYLYNNQGDTLLTRQYRSILYPSANFVVPISTSRRPNGGFAIVNVHDIDNTIENNDISLLLIDSSYQIEHYVKYGTTSKHELASSLLLDGDGGFLIGAQSTNAGQSLVNFYNRTLIIKTDSTGQMLWQYLSPVGILQDEAKAIIKTPDGGMVVASGVGQEFGNNPNIHTLLWDAMIFKLDANRNVVWSTLMRGDHASGGTKLTEMVEATDGNGYVACGNLFELTPDHNDGYLTSWLGKISLQGDSLWTRRYTIFDDTFVAPEVYDMKATPDGGYVLVGFTRHISLHAPAWIMKVDSFGCLIPGCQLTDAVKEYELIRPELIIYPNPVSDFLNFQLRGQSAQNGSFRIVDMNGSIIKSMDSVNPFTTVIVPVQEWPAGIYFLQYLERGIVKLSKKFIKQ